MNVIREPPCWFNFREAESHSPLWAGPGGPQVYSRIVLPGTGCSLCKAEFYMENMHVAPHVQCSCCARETNTPSFNFNVEQSLKPDAQSCTWGKVRSMLGTTLGMWLSLS